MKRRQALILVGLAGLVVAGGSYYLWHSKSAPPTQAGRPPFGANAPVPVVVATVEQRAVPVSVRTVGNAQAYASVAIKSRVEGQLMQVHFADGQEVKKGEVLYTIDPRPFQMQLTQAKSVLARDRAQLENARADLKRSEDLSHKGYVAQQQLDLARTNVAALSETIGADEAAIAGIQLQLEYTTLRAPLDGRTGESQVDAGNLIKANDVPLVVINQIKPIDVVFSVPEQYALTIRQRMAKEQLEVEVSDRDAASPPRKGVLSFINNTIDSTTGTVMVKATLPNEDEFFLPGQFVSVVLTLSTIPDALVIPSQAVQAGQNGDYVFVVKPDHTVELRHVTVGEAVEANVVIREGLSAGEQVVTDGQLRLFPGARAAPRAANDTRPKIAALGGNKGSDR